MQYLHFRLHANTFFFLERDVKQVDNQYSSITKGSIFHIKHTLIKLLNMGVDWPEIGPLMKGSIMFDICRYYLYTSYSRIDEKVWIQVYENIDPKNIYLLIICFSSVWAGGLHWELVHIVLMLHSHLTALCLDMLWLFHMMTGFSWKK